MKAAMLFGLVVLFALVKESDQTSAMDVSQDQCASLNFGCVVNNGYTYAIIESWDGGHQFNQNIGSCVSAATSAGISTVDLYAFLCPNCGGNNPPDQAISALASGLQSQSVSYNMLWIDVEQCSGCWNDVDSNCQFVNDAVTAAKDAGFNVGVYTSEGEWGQTVGDCSAVSDYPLWYAHYDGEASFSDPSYWQFGGWTSPYMKQYVGDTDIGCGVEIDEDYLGSFQLKTNMTNARFLQPQKALKKRLTVN